MADDTDARAPLGLKIAGVVLLVVIAWLLFGSALSIVRAALALLGYVIVGFVAYQIGKFVGKSNASPD